MARGCACNRCIDEVVPPGRYNVVDFCDVIPLMAGGDKVAELLGLSCEIPAARK
jgi:hypothetical protein